MAGQNEARDAVYDAIEKVAVATSSSNMSFTSKASALRDLAHAYRALLGGAQPGGVAVEK